MRPAGKYRLLRTPCPNEYDHTPCPKGYIEWVDWAEEMSKTHVQVECEGCKLYVVWVPKSDNRRVLSSTKA